MRTEQETDTVQDDLQAEAGYGTFRTWGVQEKLKSFKTGVLLLSALVIGGVVLYATGVLSASKAEKSEPSPPSKSFLEAIQSSSWDNYYLCSHYCCGSYTVCGCPSGYSLECVRLWSPSNDGSTKVYLDQPEVLREDGKSFTVANEAILTQAPQRTGDATSSLDSGSSFCTSCDTSCSSSCQGCNGATECYCSESMECCAYGCCSDPCSSYDESSGYEHMCLSD